MGAADSVPGVSGGTIAFISNIYEELIDSIKSLNLNAIRMLMHEDFAVFWGCINGTFLLTLLFGILTSLLLLANSVLFLLDNYPLHIMSFFSGLIIASCWYVMAKIASWNPARIMLTLLGIVLTIAVAFVPQNVMAPNLAYIFFSGALAICAMILPGISGAFVLLLLGVYTPMLVALRSYEFLTITVFVSGCVTGLITFSNLLSFLLNKYKSSTLAFLSGILMGSLYSIWPWQQASAFRENELGESVPVLYRNLWPQDYAMATGDETNLLAPLLLCVSGFALVYCLEKIAAKADSQDSKPE